MTKKSVIFDMDGVIFDTERVYMNIWMDVYKRHGLEITRDFYISLIGRDRRSIIKDLKEKFGEDFDALGMFDECDKELREAINRGEVPVKEGALDLINYLKGRNVKIALATSSHKEKLNMQLTIQNLEEIFDVLICSDDVTASKPDPTIFLVVASKLGADPKDCIVIEDSPAGIEAAHNANMTAFHVEDLKKADDNIKKYSTEQFKNLIEVKDYLILNYNL